MRKLWILVTEIYGARWTSSMGERPNETWMAVCASFSDQEFGRALVELRASTDDWPPSLKTFERWALGTPDRDEVRAMAAEAFECNPLADGTSQWDADRETYDQRDRRKRRYIAKALAEFDQDARQRQRPTLDVVGQDSSRRIGKTAGDVVPLDPRRVCPDPELR